ncbi:MAG: hypothetical protein TRG1_510 [Flavobacteriaceae bacterium FS1-H7996/R]|nr:MAG: hypothetical protein TRG1_510 [Flavobacteriaceae bacterium FS1-H7996/R]
MHSIATERKKDVEWAKKGDFLANWKKFKPLLILNCIFAILKPYC